METTIISSEMGEQVGTEATISGGVCDDAVSSARYHSETPAGEA